jgi:hypothetical protein
MSVERRHGLGFGWLVIMVLTPVLFALLYILIQPALTELFGVGADLSTSSQAAKGRGYAQTFRDYLPLIVMGAAALALIARAIFESALPGR